MEQLQKLQSGKKCIGRRDLFFLRWYDIGLSFSMALRGIVGAKAPVQMLADSKPLFDAIAKRPQTKEKRLLIDLASARDAYRSREIENVVIGKVEFRLEKAGTF